MATYTGDGLELLYLDNYFPVNLPVYKLDIFKETLTKFKNLKHVSMRYSYISDEVLRSWAVSLHHKLELMEITAVYEEPHSHVITEETWRKLRASCPKLKFSVMLKHLANCYGDRLELLDLSFFNMYSVDNELANVIKRCRYQLQSFIFAGKFGIMVPNAIFKLLNDCQSAIQTADILYLGEKDPEIEKKLRIINVILSK